MRCNAPCGKVIYTAETTAQLACVKAALGGDASLSWYYSRECGCWHLTSTAKKGNTGSRVKWVEGFKGEQERGGCSAA
jgi:3'-phosphoadenosine 5'-phosphosulfate sulfotransferase (PAPS reductase)/FAD synthetase